MKRVFILVLTTIIAGIFASGCDTTTEIENDNEVTLVLYQNMRAAEDENLVAYMATIHELSPMYAATEQQMKQFFNTYDLEYELKDIEVIEKFEQEARVKFVQITRKVSGPAFRNNKVTGIHILRKSDGKWKIYNTETEKIEYLD